MNRRQKIVIACAAFLVLAVGLYPPWIIHSSFLGNTSRIEFRFLFSAGDGTVAFSTLIAELAVIVLLTSAGVLLLKKPQ